MGDNENIVLTKSHSFAVRIVKLFFLIVAFSVISVHVNAKLEG